MTSTDTDLERREQFDKNAIEWSPAACQNGLFVDNKCTLQTDIKAHARRFLLTCPSHTHTGTFDIQGIQEQKNPCLIEITSVQNHQQLVDKYWLTDTRIFFLYKYILQQRNGIFF